MSATSRGTEWRRWDLHVHTPSSIVQHYGANNDETWERYLNELEDLPPDLSVIGINDYWFLDGYRRILEAKAEGRLQNIETIFPVVELRLDIFSGADGPWKRVNLHVVFDPGLGPETIEQQFIGAISNEFTLAPGNEGATWSGAVTRQSLEDLGQTIKANVPEKELKNYGSDLREGFNNLVVPLKAVRDLLNKSYLKGRTLVGIGRAEWADIKWADGSIATKKSVINFADLVFTASQDISTWSGLVAGLKDSRVTHKLFDCSDAHHWSESAENERLGRCSTWVNASPSFAGLSHALSEFDDRVYVGLEPPVLARMRRHPHHFIDRVRVGSSNPSKYRQFGYEVPLNSGFVAIIGNKGQGKSALLDSIAIAGNSSRTAEFAFLNPKRFLSTSNRSSKEYYSELVWVDGSTRKRGFTEGHDSAAPVQVEYLPQAFVERVCTSDPRSVEDDEFEAELRSILFTHIPEDERAGESSFDALLARRTRSVEDKISTHRRDLKRLIEDFLTLCSFRASHSLADVDVKIATKEAEVTAASNDLQAADVALKTLEIKGDENPKLLALRAEAKRLATDRDDHEAGLEKLQTKAGALDQWLLRLESLNQRLETTLSDVGKLNTEAVELLATSPADTPVPEQIVFLTVDREAIEGWRGRVVEEQQANAATTRTVQEQLEDAVGSLATVTSQLESQDSVRELARQRVAQLSDRVQNLVGDDADEESLTGLKALRARVASVPSDLDSQLELLLAKAGEIHASLAEQLDSVTALYEPAAKFIEGSKAIGQAELEFKADLRSLPTLSSLGSQIDARRSPDLPQSISDVPSRVDARSWSEIAAELGTVIGALSTDRGQLTGSFRDPELAMKSDFDVEGFLMELLGINWIEVRFGLTGGGYPLSQLSPGQRGLILALFYLVVDLRETPLLLDQPEENLDNEAISDLLVPALREAAGRRQTIVVTHNANLAVVGDADQIIHCELRNDVFGVDSGCIADLDTAQFAVNVLEGRMPSFSKRRYKWEVFPQLSDPSPGT